MALSAANEFENAVVEVRPDFCIKYSFKEIIFRLCKGEDKAGLIFLEKPLNAFFVLRLIAYFKRSMDGYDMTVVENEFSQQAIDIITFRYFFPSILRFFANDYLGDIIFIGNFLDHLDNRAWFIIHQDKFFRT